ncbi:hypothetical protein BgiBS90_029396, partial [Biomphalaria glabrata]
APGQGNELFLLPGGYASESNLCALSAGSLPPQQSWRLLRQQRHEITQRFKQTKGNHSGLIASSMLGAKMLKSRDRSQST